MKYQLSFNFVILYFCLDLKYYLEYKKEIVKQFCMLFIKDNKYILYFFYIMQKIFKYDKVGYYNRDK